MKKLTSRLSMAITILGIAVLTLLSGCEYEYVEPEVGPPPPEVVSFSTDIMPIFNASCNMSGCHAAGAFDPDLSPANAYSSLIDGDFINATDPASSLIYTSMASGTMKSFSTISEANLVLAWIQKGALNN